MIFHRPLHRPAINDRALSHCFNGKLATELALQGAAGNIDPRASTVLCRR